MDSKNKLNFSENQTSTSGREENATAGKGHRRKKSVVIQEENNQVLQIFKNEPVPTLQETMDPSHLRPAGPNIKSALKSKFKDYQDQNLVRFNNTQVQGKNNQQQQATVDLNESYESDFQREDAGQAKMLDQILKPLQIQKRPFYKPNYLEEEQDGSSQLPSSDLVSNSGYQLTSVNKENTFSQRSKSIPTVPSQPVQKIQVIPLDPQKNRLALELANLEQDRNNRVPESPTIKARKVKDSQALQLKLEIPQSLKLPQIDNPQSSISSPSKISNRYLEPYQSQTVNTTKDQVSENTSSNQDGLKIPPLSGSQSERAFNQGSDMNGNNSSNRARIIRARPSKFSLRQAGYETQRYANDEAGDGGKLPDLSSRFSSIFKRKAVTNSQLLSGSLTNAQTDSVLAKNQQSVDGVVGQRNNVNTGMRKSALDSIKQKIERAIEDSKQSKAKKIENAIVDTLQIKEQEGLVKKTFKGKDRSRQTKDFEFDFDTMRDMMLKTKYGVLKGEVYYLDTDRDELMPLQQLIQNKFAVDRILRDRVGDRSFREALTQLSEAQGQGKLDNKLVSALTEELEFGFQKKAKKLMKEKENARSQLVTNEEGLRPKEVNPSFQPESREQNTKIVSQLEEKLRALSQTKDKLVQERERQREEELKLEIQVLEKEQVLIKQHMEERRKDAENRIKQLKNRLQMAHNKVSGKKSKKIRETQEQPGLGNNDESSEEDGAVAEKVVKKFNSTFSALKDNINGQTAANFLSQLETDDNQKDVSSWLSNIASKSPAQKLKQQQKEFDQEFEASVKRLPLDKDKFEKFLDKIESQSQFMANVIEETTKGSQFGVVDRAKSRQRASKQRGKRLVINNIEGQTLVGERSILNGFEQTKQHYMEKTLENLFSFSHHEKTRNINLQQKYNTTSDSGHPVSDVNRPSGLSPFAVSMVNGLGKVETYEQAMDYYSVLPSIKDRTENVVCYMNEDVIFRIDLELHFIKPFRLEKYLFFKFPSWVDCKNGTVLFSGGLRKGDVDDGEPVQFAFIFNTRKNFLNQGAPMEIPRYKHALVVCQHKVYAFGGFSLNKSIVKSTEVYDYDRNQWSRAASLAFERADMSSFCHQASHFIYAFGGCFDQALNTTIERYNSLEDVWEILSIQLKHPLNKMSQTAFLALDMEIFGGSTYDANAKVDKRQIRKNYQVQEKQDAPGVFIYKEVGGKMQPYQPHELLVVSTYDKVATLYVNTFLDLTKNEHVEEKDFRILNLSLRGTIWDVVYYKTGLFIIRKYNQQACEYYPIETKTVEKIVLKTDKFNPQNQHFQMSLAQVISQNLEVNLEENLTEQLGKIEQTLFNQQLKKRLKERSNQEKQDPQLRIGFKEEQFIQNVIQGGNSSKLTQSVVLQKLVSQQN